MKTILGFFLLGGLSVSFAAPQFGGFNPFNFFNRPSRPSSSTFRRPSQPAPTFFSRPSSPSGSFSSSGSSSSSSSGREEEEYDGKTYLISWRVGQLGFTHGGGDSWCRGRSNKGKSYRAISIDNSAEESYFKNLVARENQKYFWTGGNVRGRSISWPSGKRYDNVDWSHTGGARPPRPQPDNREGNEFCVGVLNNFYRDGVKFHDISCHHKKPVICEEV